MKSRRKYRCDWLGPLIRRCHHQYANSQLRAGHTKFDVHSAIPLGYTRRPIYYNSTASYFKRASIHFTDSIIFLHSRAANQEAGPEAPHCANISGEDHFPAPGLTRLDIRRGAAVSTRFVYVKIWANPSLFFIYFRSFLMPKKTITTASISTI